MATLDVIGTGRFTGAVVLSAPVAPAAAPTGQFALQMVQSDGQRYLDDSLVAVDDVGEPVPVVAQRVGLSPGIFNHGVATNAWIVGTRINGSAASPTKVLAGEEIARYDSGAIATGSAVLRMQRGSMAIHAEADWDSNTDTSTYIRFLTTPDGSGTAVERVRIPASGGLLFPEVTVPAGVTDKVTICARDNGGVTELVAVLPDSSVITLAPGERVTSTTSSATPTPNADTTSQYNLTAQAAAAAFAAPTGTPRDGQKLLIRIKDNGTARALTYNAIYRAIGVTLPTTTVISKTHYIGAVYNSVGPFWDVLAVGAEA